MDLREVGYEDRKWIEVVGFGVNGFLYQKVGVVVLLRANVKVVPHGRFAPCLSIVLVVANSPCSINNVTLRILSFPVCCYWRVL
jgi:hypothetical protein